MNDNRCVICGDDIPEGRQVCKICEEVNKEVSDEVEQAFRQGFIAGTKFTAGKDLAILTECMMKAITKSVTQSINAVDYNAVYSEYKAEITTEDAQENRAMKGLLREVQPVLRNAFFAHFMDTKKADELYDRIAEIVGKE